jgi:Putative Actinobacterial Holin-X, holin superfamily III
MTNIERQGAASHTIDVREGDERGLGDLVREMTAELGELFRKEVELAKVETKEEVVKAGKAGGMFAGAGFAGWFALLFASYALSWLLDAVMPRALAFFIVGVLYAIVAGVLYMRARRAAEDIKPLPEQTIATLQEDVQWAKAQKS